MLAGESAGAVLFLLGLQDVGGAAIADEQVPAVLAVEQVSKRLDPANDHEKIVLARQGEHRVDQIVPRPLVAEIHFQAIGEEGEEVGGAILKEPKNACLAAQIFLAIITETVAQGLLFAGITFVPLKSDEVSKIVKGTKIALGVIFV